VRAVRKYELALPAIGLTYGETMHRAKGIALNVCSGRCGTAKTPCTRGSGARGRVWKAEGRAD